MTYLISGVVLGLSAGISPGPLLTLVITETLRHNMRAGIKVAIAPLVTDLPIILLTVFILSQLADMKPVLGLIAFGGAGYLFYLAYESLTAGEFTLDEASVRPQSIKKGIVTNLLNPNPYMFWLAVGTPLIFKAAETSAVSAFLFLASFYLFIVGSKIVVAVLVGKSRHFLETRGYVFVLRFLGLVLAAFGIFFVRDGLNFLGWV